MERNKGEERRPLRETRTPEDEQELVDYVSEQSFPGSDAPPYFAGKTDNAEPDEDEDEDEDDKKRKREH
jgi:hypothetical protein